MPKINSDPLLDALRNAGIATDKTRRVVIDIQVACAPVVYLEQYADEHLIQVIEAMSIVDIVVNSASKGPQ